MNEKTGEMNGSVINVKSPKEKRNGFGIGGESGDIVTPTCGIYSR